MADSNQLIEILKDIGPVSSYAIAVEHGYTGTESEWIELISTTTENAQSAVSAKNAAQAAQTAAETAESNAAGSATAAAGSATAAASSASAASGSATSAASSSALASGSAAAAANSATAAQTARTGAEAAQSSAQSILNSIPQDYSAMGADVSALKSQITQKANVDGYYESMTVGNAEQLVATVGVEDSVPYNFRTAGGSVDIGDRLVDKIVGGTIAWNQIYATPTSVPDRDLIALTQGTTVYKDHIYISMSSGTDEGAGALYLYGNAAGERVISGIAIVAWNGRSRVWKATATATSDGTYDSTKQNNLWLYRTVNTFMLSTLNIIDLTQMFGFEIADYIYGLEQANAGDGVAWFRKYFPKPYYAYDAGSLQSVQVSAHKTTGFNQWDEEWEAGSITQSGNITSTVSLRSKNYISALPNTVYTISYPYKNRTMYVFCYNADKGYISNIPINQSSVGYSAFTTPSDTRYIRFVIEYYVQDFGTYKNDICINLHWDGERDGEYEPYVEHVYPLDDSLTLKGIPKLDAANNLYYDGDTYEPYGTVTRKYGVVDLGSIQESSWTHYEYNGEIDGFITSALRGVVKPVAQDGNVANAMLYGFATVSDAVFNTDEKDKEIAINIIGSVKIKFNGIATASEFKAAMSGVYLVYELATPTTETADPFQNPQIVDDFGTEEYVDAGVTAATPTRNVAIPVGHETTYQANLRAKLEMAPDSPSDGDGDYIVRQTNGTNEYAKLVIPTELPTNPTTDGMYHLKATVSGGTTTLTWEADT